MSKFSEKIYRGEVPNEEDWAAHLIEAHKDSPSMSPRAFMQDMYFVGFLPAAEKELFGQELKAMAASRPVIQFGFPMRLFSVTKLE